MKTFYLSLFAVCLLLISCDEGDGKATDSINLSENYVEFKHEAGAKLFRTSNSKWSFSTISEDGEYVNFFVTASPQDYQFDYEGSWYRIKRNNDNIIIYVSDNPTNKRRQLFVQLRAGNWFGSTIRVVQKGKD